MKDRIQDFLTNVTAGLRDDTELQRDIRAELATHVEDKMDALRAEGCAPEACAEEALKAMGDVPELAGSIHEANRARLALRSKIRLVLRAALVPISVVVALYAIGNRGDRSLGRTLDMLGTSGTGWSPVSLLTGFGLLPGGDRLSEEEKLILGSSDPVEPATGTPRNDAGSRLREMYPEDRIFLGNHVTNLCAAWSGIRAEDTAGDEFAEKLNEVRREMAEARGIEPENARFDYVEAGMLLKGAATVDSEVLEKDDRGRALDTRYSLTVHDRERLDDAMDLFLSGTEKPYLRRYSADMLQRKLGIMGPPTRLLDVVRRTAVAAGTLLPDLQVYRELGRTSVCYAGLLAQEGKPDEARRYLGAWQSLAVQLNEDSFTLIDLLVVHAIVRMSGEEAPETYRSMGLTKEAEDAARVAQALAKPVADWRNRAHGDKTPEQERLQREGEKVLQMHAGILPQMLLPALGEWPATETYDAERMLEYTVATEGIVSLLCMVFMLGMGFCLVIALRWRFANQAGAAIPILLVPDPRKTLRTVIAGVIVPLAVFLFVTRYVTLSGHRFSLKPGGHKLLAEFVLLALSLFLVPLILTVRDVRERCMDLEIPVPPPMLRRLAVPIAILAVVLVAVWLVPAQLPASGALVPGVVAAGAIGLFLLAGLLVAFVRGIAAKPEHGLYTGTLYRSLIPIFALVVTITGLSTRPLLLKAEETYIRQDALLGHQKGEPGFSKVESDLVKELQQATVEAAESVGFAASKPTKSE